MRPKVHVQWRTGDRHPRTECTGRLIGVNDVLIVQIRKSVSALESDVRWRPSELMSRVGALQRDQCALRIVFASIQSVRIGAVEEIRRLRSGLAPSSDLDVDFVRSIETAVGEQAENDVRIEPIDRPFDEPTVRAEGEALLRVQFGTTPFVRDRRSTKLQM